MHQRFWFLSQLDVVPEMQGKGLGQTLLSKALDCATQKEADRRALITFAFNAHSIGLYIRYGFFPQVPLYLMSTSTQMLADRITKDTASAYAVRPLHEVAPTEEWVDEIDEKVLGFRRSAYHDFLSQTSPKEAMAIVSATGEPKGYCYISRTGHIGPLAIEPAADLRQAVQAVMRQAIASKHQQISIILPGFSEPLVRTASKLGFRINEPLLLMANQAFGNWQCYAPRSPGHM